MSVAPAIVAIVATCCLVGCGPQGAGFDPSILSGLRFQTQPTDPNIFQAPPMTMPMTTTCYPGMGMVRCSTY